MAGLDSLMLQLAAAASPLLEMAKSLPMDDPQQKMVEVEQPDVAGSNGERADARASAVNPTPTVTPAAAETPGKASVDATPKAKSEAARKRLASKTPDAPYRSGKVIWSKIGNSKKITFLKIMLVDFF